MPDGLPREPVPSSVRATDCAPIVHEVFDVGKTMATSHQSPTVYTGIGVPSALGKSLPVYLSPLQRFSAALPHRELVRRLTNLLSSPA